MKIRFTLIFSLLTNISLYGQSKQNLLDFDYLIHKIKIDYPGYNDKINKANSVKLQNIEANLKNRLSKFPDSSFFYFKKYLDFFNDKHLYLEQFSTDKVSAVPQNQFYKLNIDSLQNATTNNTGISGIWKSFNDEIAIIKKENSNLFLVISTISKKWTKYQILFEIKSINQFEFQVSKNFTINNYKNDATKLSLLNSSKIIEFHNGFTYVRKSNFEIADKALLYSYVPSLASGINAYWLSTSLSDSTFLLRIPTFRNEKSNSIVKENWSEIISKPNLIIDLRDNTGGQDVNYNLLSKLAYTTPYLNVGVEWYATKGNIVFFENAIKTGEIKNGEEGLNWAKLLVNVMKKNIGGFVTHPLDTSDTEIKMDTILKYPKRIGVIINQNNASSAEQFIFEIKNSSKVTLFGKQNTSGVLDYSNVVKHKLPSLQFSVAIPMTRSKRLPDNPIDNIGIKPDLNIPFPVTNQLYDRLDNWIYYVKAYLELMNK